MMSLHDFGRCCEDLEARGFTIKKAEYWGDYFGDWLIEFSSKEVPPHRLAWDGRDRWLILQCERPQSERKAPIPPEVLRQMSYEDGAFAVADRESDTWQDKWIGRDEAEHSLERALQELGVS